MRSLRSSGRVLGIDAGYSLRRRTTGVCLLTWNAEAIDWWCEVAGTREVSRLDVLRRLDLNPCRKVEALAIDGPLRPGLEYRRAYRAPEAVLSRGNFRNRGKPGPTNGGSGPRLHRAATDLAKFSCRNLDVAAEDVPIKVCDSNIVEAFPNLFLGVLCDETDYPPRPTVRRRWTDTLFPMVKAQICRMLHTLVPGRRIAGAMEQRGHEEIAALTCALTALCVAARRYVAVGSPQDGYMVLPPEEFWGQAEAADVKWAARELEGTLASSRQRFPKVERLTS